MNTRNSQRVVTSTFLGKLILRLFVTFAGGGALAGLILYSTFHQPLGASYGESLDALAQLKNTLVMKSVYIHLFSFLLIGAGVAIFCVRYSHRMLGPMIRLQRVIEGISAGDIGETIQLRKKDALHPIAEELNGLLAGYRESLAVVELQVRELRRQTEELRNNTEDRPEIRRKLETISRTAREIQKKMVMLNHDLV